MKLTERNIKEIAGMMAHADEVCEITHMHYVLAVFSTGTGERKRRIGYFPDETEATLFMLNMKHEFRKLFSNRHIECYRILMDGKLVDTEKFVRIEEF